MPYLTTEKNIFLEYRSLSYVQRMTARANRFWGNQTKQTPSMIELSPYKLHITLTNDDYLRLRPGLMEILLKSVEKGTINVFKTINKSELEDTLRNIDEMLAALTEYQERKSEDGWLTETWRNHFFTIGTKYLGKLTKLPDEEGMAEILLALIDEKDSALRFLSGDQFTIYLPEKYDRYKISALCRTINRYLQANAAQPGDMTLDVEAPICSYISMRQEYLLDDFSRSNREGIDQNKRVNTVQCNLTDEEMERRIAVKKELEESSIYQFLRDNIESTPERNRLATFINNVCGNASENQIFRSIFR